MESVYKLSVLVNLIDNMSSPVKNLSSATTGSLDKMSAGFASMAGVGAAMTAVGVGITSAALGTVKSTFATQDALAELKSLGVQDLEAVESAAKSFSDTWAGTTKSEFITAAYDIKSGISSLTDEGIAQFTELSALTAKATKATAGEMTSLFATGYGIYKDYYSDLSDLEFGELFSAGISEAVRAYKTSGTEMASAVRTIGGAATTAKVPLEEQLTIMGMLQATMSGSESGTKYKAFINAAAGAGEKLGISFMDANNQLLSMPEILGLLRGKYGETIDAVEKQNIKEAFGTDEAVAVIDLLYGKTDTLQNSIVDMYGKMGQGTEIANQMADAINSTESQKFTVLKQQIHNTTEELGKGLLPTVNTYLAKGGEIIKKVSDWVSGNQKTVATIMNLILSIGILMTVVGVTTTVIGVFGSSFIKAKNLAKGFYNGIKGIPDLLTTMQIKAMYAGDKVKAAFLGMRTGATNAVSAVKNVGSQILSFSKKAVISGVTAVKSFVVSMASMAKQAIVTAVTALPGLIASVWSFTAALLANPITWIVIGVVALTVAIIALFMNWDKVVAFLQGAWTACVNGVINAFQWIKDKLASVPQGFVILIAAIMPFIGIPLLIIKNWDTIIAFFKGLMTKVKDSFTTGINNIKSFMNGVPAWFKESGAKIISTFTEGIKNTISKPVDAVKNGLAKIRKLLPFSDAKEGPLSTLTLSGRRVFETINTGMNITKDLPSQTAKTGLKKVATEITGNNNNIADSLNKRKVSKSLRQSDINDNEYGISKSKEQNKGKTTIIQNLKIVADIRDMKDLPLLYKLIDEVKDAQNKTDSEPVMA